MWFGLLQMVMSLEATPAAASAVTDDVCFLHVVLDCLLL